MLTKGGQRVTAGTYWDIVNGSRIDVTGECTLPGGNDTLFVRAPGMAVLAAGPVLGLLFAVFLPLIGIVMTAMLVIRKVGEGVRNAAMGSTTFGWKPIEAYLAGRKRKKEAREKREEQES